MVPLAGQASVQLLFLVLVLVLAIYVAYQQYFSALARIPGPFGASLSRLWLVKHSWDGDMHRQMINLHSKYGKLVRTGPNEVSVSDLGAIKKIYGSTTLYCLSFRSHAPQNSS